MKKICENCKYWEEPTRTCNNDVCIYHRKRCEVGYSCSEWFINPKFDREKARKICGRCVYWHSESTKCVCGSSKWYETKCPDVFFCRHWLSPNNFSVKDVTQKQLNTILEQKKTIGSLRNTKKDMQQTIEQLRHSLGLTKNMKEELAYANERKERWKMMCKELLKFVKEIDDG